MGSGTLEIEPDGDLQMLSPVIKGHGTSPNHGNQGVSEAVKLSSVGIVDSPGGKINSRSSLGDRGTLHRNVGNTLGHPLVSPVGDFLVGVGIIVHPNGGVDNKFEGFFSEPVTHAVLFK